MFTNTQHAHTHTPAACTRTHMHTHAHTRPAASTRPQHVHIPHDTHARALTPATHARSSHTSTRPAVCSHTRTPRTHTHTHTHTHDRSTRTLATPARTPYSFHARSMSTRPETLTPYTTRLNHHDYAYLYSHYIHALTSANAAFWHPDYISHFMFVYCHKYRQGNTPYGKKSTRRTP